MTQITSSGGLNNTFVYNGLGMRVGKTDSSGTYSYLCDGTSPGSSVLSDGAAVYTPGQSEHRGGASSYPDFDSLGNILTIDAASGTVTQSGYLVTGFGTPEYVSGSSPTPFKYGGANGCQTDNDTGLILMGYRYYDTRIGRFISQDPIGDGANWYAYCDNNPVNLDDPLGLVCAPFDSTGMGFSQIYDYVTENGGLPGEYYETTDGNGHVIQSLSFYVSGFSFGGMNIVAPYGQNINSDIMAARNFYRSNASKSSFELISRHAVFEHDPKKIGDWLINHYGPGTTGDPKTLGSQYDAYGHAIYAAAASELRITLSTILDGEIGVHDAVHPFQPGEEENGEYAGWRYDQHNYHPGPGVWTDESFIPSAIGFAWQRFTRQ